MTNVHAAHFAIEAIMPTQVLGEGLDHGEAVRINNDADEP